MVIQEEEAPIVEVYPTEETAAEDTTVPTRSTKYNLRNRDTINKPSRYEHGLHIGMKAAFKKFGNKADNALVIEIQQMLKKNVWGKEKYEDISKIRRRKIIDSFAFFKDKYNSQGDFEKLKSRIVAGGHMQDKSIYEDLTSPTVASTAAFIVAAIAAHEGREVATVDITGAYLNAYLEKDVLINEIEKRNCRNCV
jgi:hypothetical protein